MIFYLDHSCLHFISEDTNSDVLSQSFSDNDSSLISHDTVAGSELTDNNSTSSSPDIVRYCELKSTVLQH